MLSLIEIYGLAHSPATVRMNTRRVSFTNRSTAVVNVHAAFWIEIEDHGKFGSRVLFFSSACLRVYTFMHPYNSTHARARTHVRTPEPEGDRERKERIGWKKSPSVHFLHMQHESHLFLCNVKDDVECGSWTGTTAKFVYYVASDIINIIFINSIIILDILFVRTWRYTSQNKSEIWEADWISHRSWTFRPNFCPLIVVERYSAFQNPTIKSAYNFRLH